VTGCPTLTPVNASSEKRRAAGEVILILDYDGTLIKTLSVQIRMIVYNK